MPAHPSSSHLFRRRNSALAVWTLLSALLGLALLWFRPLAPQAEASPQGPRPNIVLIITDDQRHDSLEHMPILQRELVARGVNFRNAYATTPHCCPSRASILTGQYAHHHGVLRNQGSRGGWRAFDDRSTLATWLQQSNMRTMLAGKYLNLYRSYSVPVGWDEWFAIWDTGHKFKNYTVNHNGESRFYGDREALYSARVLGEQALSWLRQPDERPFLLYLSFDGPHGPPEPARADRDSFSSYVQRLPSFNEDDVSDKPSWVQRLPPLGEAEMRRLDQFRRRQLETLQSIDRSIGAIVEQLREDGRLEHTWFIFMSDNGLSIGEHRYGPNKSCGYEECVRIPYVVTPPASLAGFPGPRQDDRLVLNLDIAPTVAAIAGVEIPISIDGRSLLPLFTGSSEPWRREAGLELWADRPATSYRGLRYDQWKYLQYDNGEQEMYDMVADPHELTNLAQRPEHAEMLQFLAGRLEEVVPRPAFLPNASSQPEPTEGDNSGDD